MAATLCLRSTVTPEGVAIWHVGAAGPAAAASPVRSFGELIRFILRAGKEQAVTDAYRAAVLLLDLPAPPEIAAEPALRPLIRELASLAIPLVAGVTGACHGPWAELASWCDRRIMSSDKRSTVGFPDVRRGEIPILGGTALSPRLIPWPRAVDWLASGDRFDAATLVEIGWADRAAPGATLREACLAEALRLADEGNWADRRRSREAPCALPAEWDDAAVDAVVERVRSAAGGYEPVARLVGQLVTQAARSDLATALANEERAAAQLAGSPVQRALARVASLARHAGAVQQDAGRPIESLAVVGAGLMGTAIASLALEHGLRVSLVDANHEVLVRAQTAVLDELAAGDAAWRSELAARLTTCASLRELVACDAAIEAVVENLDVKRTVLCELEARLAPHGLIASNTSTIPIGRMAEPLEHPDRCCGIHFFIPARLMPLVEVIRGPATSDAAIARAVALAHRVGKLPIVVRDGPGFLVNRVLFAYLNEAIQLLHEGAPIEEVDQAARTFGMPIGPIELCDLIGIDIVYYAGRTMYAAFPDRVLASPIPPALIKAKRLGRKSGAGFRVYAEATSRGDVDDFTRTLLARYRKDEQPPRVEDLTWRLVLPMLLEATRVLEEGLVDDPRDVDFGVIHGLGFPAYRGGLIYWAESLGPELRARLASFAHLGPRWQPTAWFA